MTATQTRFETPVAGVEMVQSGLPDNTQIRGDAMRTFRSRIPRLLYIFWFVGGFLALAAFGILIIDLDGGRLGAEEINTLLVTPSLRAAVVSVIWIGGLIAGAVLLPREGPASITTRS